MEQQLAMAARREKRTSPFASLAEFTKAVLALVEERLLSLGFRKRKQGIFSSSVADDVLGLIGLNKASGGRGPGILEINPVVGVRNQRVERLVAELVGEPYDELNPFSAGANVGYLAPQPKYRPFIFTMSAPLDGPADQLLDAVRMYGLPFIQSNLSLPALVETMRVNRFAIQFIAAYRIPVALHLLGKHTDEEAFLNEELAKLGTRSDAAAERYRLFARHLKDRNYPAITRI